MASMQTDAYYGWQEWETTGDPRLSLGYDNPPFSTTFYSKPPIEGGNILQRGYMRAAQPEKDGNTRFHFQFNPNAITRSNEINESALNVADQTSSDLAVAGLSGGARFNFSLFLDRQDEVASNKFAVSSRSNPNYDPEMGVLVDVAAFDRVTGIGFMPESLTTGGLLQTIINLPERINTAISSAPFAGNQAFMPQRYVRVLFSHLFMVEGLVTEANLTYAKFSLGMVPTVASLGISMRAIYIGAARAGAYSAAMEAMSSTATTSPSALAGVLVPRGIPQVPRTGSGSSGSSQLPPQTYRRTSTPKAVPRSRPPAVVNTQNTAGRRNIHR